ncbi:MAG: AMP-binding protein, partial [bacterium]|nr:AMP-binding protein [bacterium]
PQQHDRSSLRILGTVGEPIKAAEWDWYHRVIGSEGCPIVDTWWQTETGGICITPLPGATPTKPGSATFPFFGVQPVILDDAGCVLEGEAAGNLAIAAPWPGMMRTVWGDHDRFRRTYFERFLGYYFTGDGCRRDADGYYWLTGRVDDIIIVSGHNLGTAEIEGAIGQHPAVAEAAVVGRPHDVTGFGVYAFVTLRTGHEPSEEIRRGIVTAVRTHIGPHVTLAWVQFTPGLPKTRSGKIMRRVLRKIAEGDVDNLGDTSTLADPSVVDRLVAERIA